MVDTRAEFDGLLWIFVGVTGAVFLVVVLVLAYAVLRARRRAADLGWRSAWPRAEGAYAAALAAVVAVLLVFTLRAEARVDDVASDPGLVLDVTAFQWQWAFAYPNGVEVVGAHDRVPELVVPSHTTVRFRLTARDVIHSFWIPHLRFKRDAFPGYVNEFDLVFDEEGTFDGRCAEFCGLRHAHMEFDVRVVPTDQFDTWLADQAARTS